MDMVLYFKNTHENYLSKLPMLQKNSFNTIAEIIALKL